MKTDDYNIWQLLAGIGLFLFGMVLLEQAIRHLAGRSFKLFLRNQTKHPLKAVLAGIVVTAVLQSSSIVNLLILAFVGARILTMRNALAIILGSNLGSTVYNWIVVYLGFKFDIQSFAFPIMAVAAIGLIFFQENKKVMHWTRLSFGLALLFLGLSNIKLGVEEFVKSTDLSAINEYGNLVFVLAGFALTTIVQSSSTMVVITLSALNAGAIQLDAAACLVIGSESGTAMKTVIGSIGTVADKKRVGLGNLLMNITSSLVAFIFLDFIIKFISDTVGIKDSLIALVFFQSTINLIGILIFYPLLNPFSKWLEKIYGKEEDRMSLYLNKLLLHEPDEAMNAIEMEGKRLINNIILVNRKALEINSHYGSSQKDDDQLLNTKGKSYSDHYEMIKQLNGEILDFCLELKEKNPENGHEKKLERLIFLLRLTMNSAKSVKDIHHNIKDFRDSADDVLHGVYNRIREREEPFYSILSKILLNHSDINTELKALQSESTKRHDENIRELFLLSSEHKLQDVELSTLINVFDAIRNSHDSLLDALRELENGGMRELENGGIGE